MALSSLLPSVSAREADARRSLGRREPPRVKDKVAMSLFGLPEEDEEQFMPTGGR